MPEKTWTQTVKSYGRLGRRRFSRLGALLLADALTMGLTLIAATWGAFHSLRSLYF